MNFAGALERLRAVVRARIAAGKLSGRRLARETGYAQPAMCNFLNGKKGLSVDGMDRVLEHEGLTVDDLVRLGAVGSCGPAGARGGKRGAGEKARGATAAG